MIHPTAIIDPGARLGEGVEVGPYAVIGPKVAIGDGSAIGPHAIIESPEEVAAHAVTLAKEGIDFGGQRVRLDTLCLHGDNLQAAQNAKMVREALSKSGIEVRAL